MFETLNFLTFAIAIIAVTISGLTLWLTFLRRGKVTMTRPTQFYFGADGGLDGQNKVHIRSLLYSTGPRRWLVEQIYVRVIRGETIQSFPIWVFGEGELSRGIGLAVGPEGIIANHHFLLPPDGTSYEFRPGQYTLEVLATIVGQKHPNVLQRVSVDITDKQSTSLKKPECGIYFDWSPDQCKYLSHTTDESLEDSDKPAFTLNDLHEMETGRKPLNL